MSSTRRAETPKPRGLARGFAPSLPSQAASLIAQAPTRLRLGLGRRARRLLVMLWHSIGEMDWRRQGPSVLALAILVLGGCEWLEQPGPRLRRECSSLVDEVLKQDQTVPTGKLEQEFSKLPGGTLPQVPPYPRSENYRPRTGNRDRDIDEWLEQPPKPGSPRAKYLADVEAYDSAKKAREARLDELVKQYPNVWTRLFQQRREEAINQCIVTRAKKEGVVDP
jgi:hypothetical protein